MGGDLADDGRMQTGTQVALLAGLAVPITYFGSQLAAAPFYEGYRFLSQDASTLGSAGSTFPIVFNAGMLLTALASWLAAYGFARGLSYYGTPAGLRWLTIFGLLGSGLGNLNAALFPLPDPRHSGGPLAVAGTAVFLVPLVLPFAVKRLQPARWLTVYLWLNLACLVAQVPIMSGLIQRGLVASGTEWPAFQSFLNNYHGLLQRITAATLFLPIGAVALFLLRTRRQRPKPTEP